MKSTKNSGVSVEVLEEGLGEETFGELSGVNW